jgi:hypothetical protein
VARGDRRVQVAMVNGMDRNGARGHPRLTASQYGIQKCMGFSMGEGVKCSLMNVMWGGYFRERG